MTFAVDRTRAKRISVLAAPIVIAMFTQTFINIVDTIFVGKLDASYSIPGQSALGFSLPILWAIGGFLAAVGIGTQAMTARRFGARDDEGAGVVLANSAIVAVLTSLVFTVIGWAIIPTFFDFLTSNESVRALGVPYAQVRILGVLALVTTTGFKGFFDGIGRTRVHMYAALIMNGANIILNYLLIFGVGPIEPMYVTGAGVASLISTYIGLTVMVIWTMRHKYRSVFRYWRVQNVKPRVMWEIIKLSAPSGAAQVFVMSGVLIFLKIVGMLDDEAIHTTIQQIALYQDAASELALQTQLTALDSWGGLAFTTDWSIAVASGRPPIFTTAAKLIIDLLSIGFVTCIAFGTATATLVSQSLGEKRPDLAEHYGWDSVRMGMYAFGLGSIAILFFPEAFLDLLSDDVSVIEAAVPGLQLVAGVGPLSAAALILTQALFGAGDTKFVMYTEMILHGFCLAPLAWFFALYLDLGFIGVWLAAAVYVVALAIVMAVKFAMGSWKEIQV